MLIKFNAKKLSNICEPCNPFPITVGYRGEMLSESIENAWSQVYSEGVKITNAMVSKGGVL